MYIRNGIPSRMANDPNFDTGIVYAAKGMHASYRAITDEARASYYLATGITPQMQIELEAFYAQHALSWEPPAAQMSVDVPPAHISYIG